MQRRLTSIVQNSTDVITIVGADERIRWQAASIREVLAQDAGALRRDRISATSSTPTTAPRWTATSPRPAAARTTRAT